MLKLWLLLLAVFSTQCYAKVTNYAPQALECFNNQIHPYVKDYTKELRGYANPTLKSTLYSGLECFWLNLSPMTATDFRTLMDTAGFATSLRDDLFSFIYNDARIMYKHNGNGARGANGFAVAILSEVLLRLSLIDANARNNFLWQSNVLEVQDYYHEEEDKIFDNEIFFPPMSWLQGIFFCMDFLKEDLEKNMLKEGFKVERKIDQLSKQVYNYIYLIEQILKASSSDRANNANYELELMNYGTLFDLMEISHYETTKTLLADLAPYANWVANHYWYGKTTPATYNSQIQKYWILFAL